MSSIGLAQVIASNYDQILKASDSLGFDFYDTCAYWPYLYTVRLKDDIQVYIRRSIMQCVVRKDISSLYPFSSWIVPFSQSTDEFLKDFSFIRKDSQLPISYFPEKALSLFDSEDPIISKKKYSNHLIDRSYKTEDLLKLQEIKDADEYSIVKWSEHDTKKANELVDAYLVNTKGDRPDGCIIEEYHLREIAYASYHTYTAIPGKGIFLEKYDKYEAFGLGIPISNKKWTVLFCINSCKDTCMDRYIYKKLAEMFIDYEIESDGCKINNIIENYTINQFLTI
jgi:hypothetical protein